MPPDTDGWKSMDAGVTLHCLQRTQTELLGPCRMHANECNMRSNRTMRIGTHSFSCIRSCMLRIHPNVQCRRTAFDQATGTSCARAAHLNGSVFSFCRIACGPWCLLPGVMHARQDNTRVSVHYSSRASALGNSTQQHTWVHAGDMQLTLKGQHALVLI